MNINKGLTNSVSAAEYGHGQSVDEDLLVGLRPANLLEGRPSAQNVQLVGKTVLSGEQVRSLLFGHEIEGRSFWTGSFWSQVRSDDGEVSHAGSPVHPGMSGYDQGESWIEDNRLCDRWPDFDKDLAWCALIFRNPDGSLEFRNEYFMVTGTGLNPTAG